MDDIVILSGARTAIGTFGGTLAGVPPIELGATAAKAALDRAGVEGDRIGHVAFGHVINTEPRDMYLSRVASMQAGVPDTTPAMNVNRLCGSGAQAIVSVIQSLALGDAEYGLAGWRRKHEPRTPHPARGALGPEDGRCARARHDDRRAALPLRHRTHGRDGGKRRGRAPDHPRRSGRFLRWKARNAPPAPSRKGASRSRSCRSK